MALDAQTVNVNLRGGMDLKTDKRLVIPSKLTLASDVEFQDSNTIVTRPGLTERTLAAGYASAVRMFEHAGVPNIEFTDGKTLRANGSTIASQYARDLAFAGGTDTFARVGVLTNRIQGLTRKETGIGASLYGVTFDCAVGTTTYCLVWEQDRQGFSKWSVRDLATDVEISGGTLSSGTDRVVKPRVIYDSTNARFAIFYARYVAGGTLFNVYGAYTPAAGGALTTVGIIITTAAGAVVESVVGAAALFDVAIYQAQGYAVVARSTVAAGNVYMRLVDLSLAAIVATTNAAPAAVPVSLTAHATFSAGVLLGHAIYGAGLNLRGYRLPSNTGVQSAEVTIAGPFATTLVGRVVVTDYSGDLLVTFDGFTSTANLYAFTNVLRCTTAHVFVSQVNATTLTGFIAGRSFSMRGHDYVPVLFTSAQFQSVLLVFDLTVAAGGLGTLDFPTSIVARVDWGDVAQPSPLALDSAHRVPGCSQFLMPYVKYETNTRLAGVTNNTELCVAAARFSPTEQLGDAKWNGLTYLAGALPMITDGTQLVEEGFHFNPEVVGAVVNGLVVIPPIATGTGVFDFPGVGTFIVAFTETWEDAQGNWHESGIASLCSVTTTGGNLAIKPTILRPSSLKGTRKLQMYRTLQSSTNTTLYLAQSDEFAVGAVVSEANLPFGEPLYTEGGVLPNTPAPSCRHIALFQKRMVLSGCGDGSKLYWSKENDQGFAAEFVSDDISFQQIIPSKAGRAVATAEMNGKLVVTGEQELGIIYGTGPNSSGTQGQYNAFETVAENIGALWIAPKSVRLSAEGVWFQSPFGLRLFTGQGIARDPQSKFIGSEMDAFVNSGGESIVTLPGGSTQQTRFFMRSLVIVWDQTWGQFTYFTNHSNVDAVLVSGTYFIVTSGATPHLYFRDEGAFADHGVVLVKGLIVTAPLQFGGIQGFQRIYDMFLLGGGVAGDTLAYYGWVAYDGAPIPVTAEFGDTSLVGAGGQFEFQHQFFTQKCSSLVFSLQFWDTTSGGRVRLTDIALSVGVKRGPWKSAEIK